MSFISIRALKYCVEWIKDWFEKNADNNTAAIVNIDGDISSAVTAGLLVEALGKDKVFGVIMPDNTQKDITNAKKVCKELNIKNTVINIGSVCKSLYHEMLGDDKPNDRVSSNVPSRIRMTTLYAVASTYNDGNCKVANTSNLSDIIMGSSNIYGSLSGDFAPIIRLTLEEVIAIKKDLNLSIEPKDAYFYNEVPSKEISNLCRKGIVGDNYNTILKSYRENSFQTRLIQLPYFEPNLINFLRRDSFEDGSLVVRALDGDFGEVVVSPAMERATVVHVTKDNLERVYNWLVEYVNRKDFVYEDTDIELNDDDSIQVSLAKESYCNVKTINVDDYVVVNNRGLIVYMCKEELLENWELCN